MKRIVLVGTILALASLACATFESYFSPSENSNSGGAQQPTSIVILQPTATTSALAPSTTPNLAAPTAETMATNTPQLAGQTGTPATGPTPTLSGPPSTRNFYTCIGPCSADGSNDQGVFAERSEIIYFQFAYENFPVGASYTRWWTRNGVEWARYQCAWPGPSSGLEQITLTEPNGLASGTWQVTITIDGVIVLQETLVVQGSWNYWDPAGFFGACYGKR